MKPLVILLVLVFSSLLAHAGETVFYTFKGKPDGYAPVGGLISDQKGNLFGVTTQGGIHGLGTVFELSPNGANGWNETVVYSFTGGADDQYPGAGLIMDSEVNPYGTTFGGTSTCAPKCGSVFEVSPGANGWTINCRGRHCHRTTNDTRPITSGQTGVGIAVGVQLVPSNARKINASSLSSGENKGII